MDNNCVFCTSTSIGNSIFRTSNFFLYIDDSPLTEGHCLICTQEHIPSFADLDPRLFNELTDFLAIVRGALEEIYGCCILFEHGRTASCVTKNPEQRYCHHAHIHAIPINTDLHDTVSKILPKVSIKNISEIGLHNYDGYLFVEGLYRDKYIFPVVRQIPTHYLRTCVALNLGILSLADWQQNIGSDDSKKRISAAKDKLQRSLSGQKIKLTIDCYNQMAESFVYQTKDTNMDFLYLPFLELLPPHARILDAGCGSGRDVGYFSEHGYSTIGFDASEKLVMNAINTTGCQILNLSFNDLIFYEEFDGVWACASLIHTPLSELDQVIDKLICALKNNGILFMSFKSGEYGEMLVHHRKLDGFRFFNIFNEEELLKLINRHSNLSLVNLWKIEDTRPDQDTTWLNIIVKRIK